MPKPEAIRPAPSIQKLHVSFIGCGHMGKAMLKAFATSSQAVKRGKYSFSSCVKTTSSCDALNGLFDGLLEEFECVTGLEECRDMIRQSDIVILACKAEDLGDVTARQCLNSALNANPGPTIVTILGGVSLLQLRKALDVYYTSGHSTLVRVIPSPGAAVGKSMSYFSTLPWQDPEEPDIQDVVTLFKEIGSMQLIPEDLMNQTMALTSVCNALTVVSIEALSDAAAAEGLPRELAADIASTSIRNAITMLQTGHKLSDFKESVATPKGTSIRSIIQLEKEAKPAIAACLAAASEHINVTPNAREPTSDDEDFMS